MDAKPKTKDEELLLRVFALIKDSHFRDHKMVPNYLTPISFKRGLGRDIANLIQARFPEYYHEERRRHKANQ